MSKFYSKSRKGSSSTTKHEPEYHELGYDIHAPLPYCLTLEEIYGKVPELNKSDYDPTDIGTTTAELLKGFLEENQSRGNLQGNPPQIEESTFVRSYLPHFYNDNRHEVNELDPSITQAWIFHVSGHAYNHVDVMRNGELIYRVPPILGRLNIIGSKDRDVSVNNAYKDMERFIQRNPNPAVIKAQHDFFVNNMFNPSEENARNRDFKAKINYKYLFTLNEIFMYYGYDSILPPDLMQYKAQVLGVEGDQSGRTVFTPHHPTADSIVEDDDDLFG